MDGDCERGTLEYRTDSEMGSVNWIRDTVFVENEGEGDSRQTIGIARDITEHKKHELELRRKERRYQAIFDDPNVLVGLLDTDGTVLDINETAMDYVDVTRDDVVGEPLWETAWFDHSESLRDDIQTWIDRASDGEYVEFEANLVRSTGEPYTVEGVFRPVTNDEGEVVSLIISDREVIEQKEYERALERTNALLSTLFETLPVGVLAEDEKRNVVAVNEELIDLFDLPGAQMRFTVSTVSDWPKTSATCSPTRTGSSSGSTNWWPSATRFPTTSYHCETVGRSPGVITRSNSPRTTATSGSIAILLTSGGVKPDSRHSTKRPGN